MFSPAQYRAKAYEFGVRAKAASSLNERNEFQKQQRSFSVMADNEEWLANNYDQTVHTNGDERAPIDDLAAEEERVLRCLGAAVIMQWNMLPATLQQELFDNAGSLGPLRDVGELRAQIARFLQKHDQMCNDAAQLGLSK